MTEGSGSERTVIKTQPKRGEDDVYHEDPECRYLGHATTAREVPRSSISGQRRPCSACSQSTENGPDLRADGGVMQTLHHDLINRARDAEEPVVEVDRSSDYLTIYRAVQQVGDRVWRCDIEHDSYYDDHDPHVKFRWCIPAAEPESLSTWTPTATGAFGGPQRFSKWEALFTVFNAAHSAYLEEHGGGSR